MEKPLQKEFNYYVANQDEIVKQYQGKQVVIKGEEIIGHYEDMMQAIKETMKTHALGTFMVHPCEPGEENYTAKYSSPII